MEKPISLTNPHAIKTSNHTINSLPSDTTLGKKSSAVWLCSFSPRTGCACQRAVSETIIFHTVNEQTISVAFLLRSLIKCIKMYHHLQVWSFQMPASPPSPRNEIFKRWIILEAGELAGMAHLFELPPLQVWEALKRKWIQTVKTDCIRCYCNRGRVCCTKLSSIPNPAKMAGDLEPVGAGHGAWMEDW